MSNQRRGRRQLQGEQKKEKDVKKNEREGEGKENAPREKRAFSTDSL